MSSPSPDDVRAFVAAFLNVKLKERGKAPLDDLRDDYDLLMSGLLNSLTFVEMMLGVGARFDGQVDFEELDPEKMTIVGPLCMLVSEQLRRGDAR